MAAQAPSRLQFVRVLRGVTQADLADRCGISLRTLQRIESGGCGPEGPPIGYLLRLKQALRCQLEDIIEPGWGTWPDPPAGVGRSSLPAAGAGASSKGSPRMRPRRPPKPAPG